MNERIVRPTNTCAPCSPVRPKKTSRERAVDVLKPMRVVLDHLRQQEGEADEEREHEPRLQPGAVAAS